MDKMWMESVNPLVAFVLASAPKSRILTLWLLGSVFGLNNKYVATADNKTIIIINIKIIFLFISIPFFYFIIPSMSCFSMLNSFI
jgi:hypothetical protein